MASSQTRTGRRSRTREAAPKKSRSGSENRAKSDYLGLRLYPVQRLRLDFKAKKEGFKTAQELIMHRMQSDLAGAWSADMEEAFQAYLAELADAEHPSLADAS